MILKGLALGFTAGIFCIGFCYPVLGPLMLSKQESGFKSSAISLAIFILGRLFAYLLFGAVFGLIGGMISSLPSFRTVILPIAYLVLGILMILYGLVTSFPHWSLCRSLDKYFQNRKSNLIFGFLTGINICPPFLLAITTATELGKPWYGIVFFFFFFLATTVYLLPFLFFGFISRFKDIRIAARVVAVLAGVWFVYRSIASILG
ncbi:MAG: sulfite exporter TauE/SafE family protein [candidate division WOR-3 bacterium]|nr:sulfite exporter TauE/SafE family protein [candidate division WOR-3 bacterium]MDH5684857.1 sulfite exporter TauE/SafE family protein [candidate division WOR-3 bacterium]